MVDEEFWKNANTGWARLVFETATQCSYGDGTGEPGFINIDKLKQDNSNIKIDFGNYVGSEKYQIEDSTHIYLHKLSKKAQKKKYQYTLNPCGEQTLHVLGAYCALCAIAPYHCVPELTDPTHKSHEVIADDKFEQAVRMAVRASVRINLMDSLYKKEVKRTNRIGVGLIGIHEWMWARFGLTFRDALDEYAYNSHAFWGTLEYMGKAAEDEAKQYSEKLGLNVPHTVTTVPPGGTISKLFNLTEGVHLPAMKYYLRWVQFRDDDPLVRVYQEKGYPTRVLEQYKGHTIVGFPTKPTLSKIMPEDKIVTASEATPEEQYKWVRLLEKYWLGEEYGSQISYTLKFDPNKISLHEFQDMVKEHQPKVKCCSIMPQEENIASEYQPEEPISFERYNELLQNIEQDIEEEIDEVNLKCENGSCSWEFNTEKGVLQDGGYF
jgi:hypothetical protein